MSLLSHIECCSSWSWSIIHPDPNPDYVRITPTLIDLFKSCMELCNIILFTTVGFALSYARYSKPRNGYVMMLCSSMPAFEKVYTQMVMLTAFSLWHTTRYISISMLEINFSSPMLTLNWSPSPALPSNVSAPLSRTSIITVELKTVQSKASKKSEQFSPMSLPSSKRLG